MSSLCTKVIPNGLNAIYGVDELGKVPRASQLHGKFQIEQTRGKGKKRKKITNHGFCGIDCPLNIKQVPMATHRIV